MMNANTFLFGFLFVEIFDSFLFPIPHIDYYLCCGEEERNNNVSDETRKKRSGLIHLPFLSAPGDN